MLFNSQLTIIVIDLGEMGATDWGTITVRTNTELAS